MDKRLLKLTLNSGSAKVFNVLDVTRRAGAEGEAAGATPQLFSVRPLNHGIFFKIAAREPKGGKDETLDTVLYFPYDAERAEDGGMSVSLNDRRFDAVMREFTEVFGTNGHSNEATDRAVLRVLKESPSLDPFLLKTGFLRMGLRVPDAYLQITREEWNAIRDHVRAKLMPMIEFGISDPRAIKADRIEEFVEKVWDGSDVSCLYPLIQTLGLPVADADEVIFSWKGLTFYEFQYQRRWESIKLMADWFREHSQPSDFVPQSVRLDLEGRREEVKRRMRGCLTTITGIIQDYDQSYAKLFKRKEGAGDLQRFLGACRTKYLDMGAAFNRIDHAYEVFDKYSRGNPRVRLRSDTLEELYGIMYGVLR